MSATGLILRAEGRYSDNWIGNREVYIVGYHHLDRRAEFLFQVFAENNLEGRVDNFLYALHPGNVSFKQLDSWPMPRHSDEPPTKKSLLDLTYGTGFRERGGEVFCRAILTAWDSWWVMPEEPVYIFQQKEAHPKEYISRSYPLEPTQYSIPFTVLKLGPFTQKGLVLITFGLTLQGIDYDELVARDPIFCIYGPEAILLELNRRLSIGGYSYLQNREAWKEELEKFKTHMTSYTTSLESMDIIVINNPPHTDEVISLKPRNGIVSAPIQPSKKANRFISAFPRFVLPLKYSNSQLHERIVEDYNSRMAALIQK